MRPLPLVWAHRGASGYAPENTLISFQKAIELHADGIELDIQLTKDNEIVVCHDEMIDRTSNGSGWLKDMTLTELRQYDFNKTFPELGPQTIPTMKEVFELIKDTNLTIDIELKTAVVFYPQLEEKILAMVEEYGMKDRVQYCSFNHYTCKRLHELDPNTYVGFLYMDGAIEVAKYAHEHGANAINPALYCLQYPNIIEDCTNFDMDINAWTVNTEEYVRKCVDLGLHAVITNYPDMVRKVYQEFK